MSIRKQYDTDLEALKAALVEMGSNSAEAVEAALEALCTADAEAAQKIVKGDSRINNMERDIEHRCMTLLLRQQPVAGDLRRISTAMKVVTDIERIGDHASDIAEIIPHLVTVRKEGDPAVSQAIAMGRKAYQMIQDAMAALTAEDELAARKVIAADDAVDFDFNAIKHTLAQEIAADPAKVDAALDLLMVIKYLERIGDHAVSSCAPAVIRTRACFDQAIFLIFFQMGRAVQFVHRRPFLLGKIIQKFLSFRAIFRDCVSYTKCKGLQARPAVPVRWVSGFPPVPARRTVTEEIQMMQTKNEMLESRTEAVSRDALVRAALQEITQNYREASLSNVARAYGVSLAYVSECVRAQTGKTYKELLQRHRMETAARLLRRSDLNIQQIIAQVGYENTSYFYRLFHERYGLSPREYRQVRAVRSRTTA